jgi:hypothetical protein
MRIHRPIGDFHAAKPDAATFLNASSEVVPGNEHVASRVFRIAETAESASLGLGIARQFRMFERGLVFAQAFVHPPEREEQVAPNKMAAGLDLEPTSVFCERLRFFCERLRFPDIVERPFKLIENPPGGGAAEQCQAPFALVIAARARACNLLRASASSERKTASRISACANVNSSGSMRSRPDRSSPAAS